MGFLQDFRNTENIQEYGDGVIQGIMLVDLVPGLKERVIAALETGPQPPEGWHFDILADLEHALGQNETEEA